MNLSQILGHPRLNSLFRGASPVERFLLASVLHNADEEDVNDMINQLYPAGPDFSAVVAGMPLAHWLGKSEEQLRRELDKRGDVENVDDTIAEIHGAIQERTGVETASDPQAVTGPDVFDRRTTNPGGAELTPRDPDALTTLQRRAGVAPGGVKPGTSEPTFGEDQAPASELFGKTDAELLELPGVGPAAVKKIRALQQERGVSLPEGATDGANL